MGYHLTTADDARPSRPVTKYPRDTRKTHRGPIFCWILSSKYTDGDTGLIYYGYRYYQPEVGRWASKDPLGEKGGKNLYRFVRNQCIQRVDIFGLCELGTTKNEKCEASVYPWSSSPGLEKGKDDLVDLVGDIEAFKMLMDAATILVSAGKSIEEALREAATQLVEDGYSLDPEKLAKKGREISNKGHGEEGGWMLSTRINYEACVCGTLWGTKWEDHNSVWKEFSMGAKGDYGTSDRAFLNKWEAYGRIGKACADHLAEFKGEKIP